MQKLIKQIWGSESKIWPGICQTRLASGLEWLNLPPTLTIILTAHLFLPTSSLPSYHVPLSQSMFWFVFYGFCLEWFSKTPDWAFDWRSLSHLHWNHIVHIFVCLISGMRSTLVWEVILAEASPSPQSSSSSPPSPSSCECFPRCGRRMLR